MPLALWRALAIPSLAALALMLGLLGRDVPGIEGQEPADAPAAASRVLALNEGWNLVS